MKNDKLTITTKIVTLAITFLLALFAMIQSVQAQTQNPIVIIGTSAKTMSTDPSDDTPSSGALNTTSVNAIDLKGLGNHIGKYLSVYYARGTRASISLSSSQIHMSEVKIKLTMPITSDTVSIRKFDLPRSGFFLAYNIIVFVVHREKDFIWQNLMDPITPKGESEVEIAPSMLKNDSVDSLTRSEFEALRDQQGTPHVIYTFSSN